MEGKCKIEDDRTKKKWRKWLNYLRHGGLQDPKEIGLTESVNWN